MAHFELSRMMLSLTELMREGFDPAKTAYPHLGSHYLAWIKSYRKSDVKYDLQAGITVCALLVPQGMTYAFASMLSLVPRCRI